MKTTRDLQDALKEANANTSLPTLRKYEAKGVIIKPAQYSTGPKRKDRQYTDEEIKIIIAQVESYRYEGKILNPDSLNEEPTAQTNT